MDLAYRLLKTEAEFEEFASKSCALVGNSVTASYFQAGRVVGAYLNGEMIGGWALSNPASVPLRCHKMLPEGTAPRQELNRLAAEGLVSELTQVWLNSSVSSPFHSVRFWRRLAKDMLENSNKNLIFGFRTTNAGLHNLYRYLNPRILHSGPVSVGPDIKTHAQVTIMLIERNAFRFLVVRFAPEIFKRLFRNTRGVKRVSGLKGRNIETREFKSHS